MFTIITTTRWLKDFKGAEKALIDRKSRLTGVNYQPYLLLRAQHILGVGQVIVVFFQLVIPPCEEAH